LADAAAPHDRIVVAIPAADIRIWHVWKRPATHQRWAQLSLVAAVCRGDARRVRGDLEAAPGCRPVPRRAGPPDAGCISPSAVSVHGSRADVPGTGVSTGNSRRSALRAQNLAGSPAG